MNIENIDNSNYSEATELITKEVFQEIFEIVHIEEKGYMLTLGRYALTEYFETNDEIETYMNENMFLICFRIAHIVADVQNQLNNQKKN